MPGRGYGWPLPLLAQRPLHDQVLLDDLPRQEVLLEDALQHGGIAVAVPGALGVDDGDGSARADVEAVGAGRVDAAVLREAQLLEALAQELPGLGRALAAAALGLGGIAAEEDVALDLAHPP